MRFLSTALIATALLFQPVRAADGHGHGHEDDHHDDHHHAKPAPKPAPKPAGGKAPAPAPAKADTHAPAAHSHDEHDLEAHEDGHGDGHGAASAHGKDAHGAKAAAPQLKILVKGALQRLQEGNRRYSEGKSAAPRRGKDQRTLVAKAQLPFAIIVGCADSRVPPEIAFDQGLGDLFVVRVAGNVVDDLSMGSIEYAVEHLGSRLIVVLGHERCGAVDAACKGGNPGAHIGSLVQAIKPAVEVARRHKGDNLLADAVKANVERVVDQLKGSWPILGPEVREEKLTIVGGIYDLETGLVEFIQ